MKAHNKISLIIACFCMLFSLSCKKFLDVRPKTTIEEELLFKNKQGFNDALLGIYQVMARPAGYGRELTFGAMDQFAQRYENRSTAGSVNQAIATYNYTQAGVKDKLSGMFSNSYSAIAQCNFVLKHVDNGVLSPNEYNLVKGEALGLRAFLHFDLARLFSDNYDGGANAVTPSIAYSNSFSVRNTARLNLGKVLELCEADLKEAEVLLGQTPDPNNLDKSGIVSERLLQFRHNRMNYWAVKGTLARLYQLKGDRLNAFKYATEVINGNKFSFVNQVTLNVDPLSNASDPTFYQEHIFSLYISNLKVVADDVFKNASTTNALEINDLYSLKASLAVVYPANFTEDIRSNLAPKSLWHEFSTAAVYTKKYWSDATANNNQKMIPIIKLSEMYYIASENAPDLTTAATFFNTVRNARLIPGTLSFTTQAQLDAELLLEYRKEFYAEGQLWLYYKRKNLPAIWNGSSTATLTIAMSKAKYIFPLPDAELEFGSTNYQMLK